MFPVLSNKYLKQAAVEMAYPFSKRGYIAPTVFYLQGKAPASRNYYTSLQDALDKMKYLYNAGGRNVTPAGNIRFTAGGAAQTIGINADFFMPVTNESFVSVPYAVVRSTLLDNTNIPGVFSFYTTDGRGPFYSTFEPANMGVSASKVDGNNAKVKALDTLHRQLELMKIEYNKLTVFINEANKQPANPVTTLIIANANVRKATMLSQMQSIDKDIKFNFLADTQIGFIQLPIIAWILIFGAAAAAWTIDRALDRAEKSRRITEGFNQQKFVADQKQLAISKLNNKEWTQQQYDVYIKTLDGIALSAQDVIDKSSKEKGGLVDIAKFGMIAIVALAVSKFAGN